VALFQARATGAECRITIDDRFSSQFGNSVFSNNRLIFTRMINSHWVHHAGLIIAVLVVWLSSRSSAAEYPAAMECVVGEGQESDSVEHRKDEQSDQLPVGNRHDRTAAQIGREIFLDTGLSRPAGQACVSCHIPSAAFADPRSFSPGAVKGRKGVRNAPSLMYAALIPGFAYEDLFTDEGTEIYAYEGGLFHDGRARDLFDQVQQPFFDRNEMNLPDTSALADRLRRSEYAVEFKQWIGSERWKDDSQLTYHAYRALVEFLKEPMFRPFDARIDDFLAGDTDALTKAERRGLEIFRGAGKCADCHFLEPTSWTPALLSDYGYDNLGVPSRGEKDAGLGARIGAEGLGQFRAPSLRNVALTAPYMHNGSIASLQEVMEFYNKRDLEPQRWGPTDYPETVNREDIGKLNLTDQQIKDLVALMSAFTDRSVVERNPAQLFPEAPKGTPSTTSKRLYFPDWTHRLHPAFPGVVDSFPASRVHSNQQAE
jgi:cytochrome c peroxidase